MPPRKKANRGKEKALAFAPCPSGFPALPLDILFEVFSLLHPLDLLHLARTTKPFRRFLLNRANVGIWNAAFSALREGGLPECPPYAAYPAWTRLVFEKVCNVCSTNLRDNPNLDPVWWEFSARFCGGCMTAQVAKTTSQKLKRIDPKRNWKVVFPSVPRNCNDRDTNRYYLTAHQTELLDACSKTEDREERAAIIQQRVQETYLITQHSTVWRAWGQKQIANRRTEAASRQAEKEKARVDAIVAKLTTLGWSDEPWMYSGSLESQIRTYPSVVVARNLTPRAYRELEPALLSLLKADKRKHILRNRLQVFQSALPLIITQEDITNLALDISPRRSDIALIPIVRELLDKEGDAEVEKDDLVATLRPQMPALLRAWVEDTLVQISEYAGRALKLVAKNASIDEAGLSNNQVQDPLSLAVAFFGCPQGCGTTGHMNTLLKHNCTQTHPHWLYQPYYVSYTQDEDAYRAAADSVFYPERRFTPSILDFGSHLDAMEGVVKAYGLDPKTTTIKNMANERRFVNCVACVARAEDPRERSKPGIMLDPMDWLAAMKHSLGGHRSERRDGTKIEWHLRG